MPPTHLISAHSASFTYRIWAFPITITYADAPSLPPRDQNRTIYRSSCWCRQPPAAPGRILNSQLMGNFFASAAPATLAVRRRPCGLSDLSKAKAAVWVRTLTTPSTSDRPPVLATLRTVAILKITPKLKNPHLKRETIRKNPEKGEIRPPPPPRAERSADKGRSLPPRLMAVPSYRHHLPAN